MTGSPEHHGGVDFTLGDRIGSLVTDGLVTEGGATGSPGMPPPTGSVVVPIQTAVVRQKGTAESTEECASGSGGPSILRLGSGDPSPDTFLDAIQRADAGHGVVVLTVSRTVSSAYEAAVLAARSSDTEIAVLDTGTVGGGHGLVVSAAVRHAATGAGLNGVAAFARLAASRVRMVAEVGNLSPLVRTGRLPDSLANVGNAVGLRPVFEFRGGSIGVLRPALSERAGIEALIGAWRASIQLGQQLHVTVTYGRDQDLARSLLQMVSWEFRPMTASLTRFGPAVLTRTGPDILGLAWWWEPSPCRPPFPW
jgi:DegV family protein with EDD domain